MGDVFIEFENDLRGRDGRVYEARACGRERPDHLWEGWIEFVPRDSEGVALRTARETTQPNREDLSYWATGLTVGFLEGALERAIGSKLPELRQRAESDRPAYSGPRESIRPPQRASAARAVLNPFSVYAKGEHLLRGQLGALDEGKLRNIIRAHDLAPGTPATALDVMSAPALRDLIMAAVWAEEAAKSE